MKSHDAMTDYEKSPMTEEPKGKNLWIIIFIMAVSISAAVYMLLSAKGSVTDHQSQNQEPSQNTEHNKDRSESTTVEFKDPALEKEICRAMGVSGRPVTKKEAAKVKVLNLAHEGDEHGDISDLTGLSCFTKLEELDLSNNKITDVSELSEMKHLKKLHLEGNQISEVKPLASLNSLKLLDLEGNKISNIYVLKDLKGLTVFDIRNNYVADISIIADMKNMEQLYIRNNYITDITPLEGLRKVTYLSMGDNSIEDISPIRNMKKLTHLIICGNGL